MVLTYRSVGGLVLIVSCCRIATSVVCPDKGDNGGPGYVVSLESQNVIARLGHYVELRCCASNFTKISWYKQDGKTWELIQPGPMHLDPSTPTFVEGGQILVIKSVSENDNGNYKCILEKDGSELDERIFSLSVAECDELARGPYPIAPLPCDITSVSLGGAITLPCNGYFGCEEDELDMRIVMWLVTDSTGPIRWSEISEVSDRYSVKYIKRNGNAELGANLTIRNIQPEDLNRKFMCLLSTPQIIHGESKLVVQLQDNANLNLSMDAASVDIIIILSTAGGVLLAVLCFLTTFYIIRYKRKQEQRSKSFQNTPEKEHMFTMHSKPICNNEFDV